MTYRVIALDLDGTLLNSQKQILPESLQALAQAQQAGIQVVIATGRHHVAIHPFYQALHLTTPAICCNGAYLYDYPARRVLAASPLLSEQAHQVLQLLQRYPLQCMLYVDDAMLYQQVNDHVIRTQNWSAGLPPEQRPTLRQVDSLAACIDEAQYIWKFATASEDSSTLQAFARTVEQELRLSCEWSWHDQMDVGQQGNSKGRRLQQWVESQGLTMASVVAFGDNYNDIDMLGSAGLGVAMGNSDDAIKAKADLVIQDNDRPGIAEVIYNRVL